MAKKGPEKEIKNDMDTALDEIFGGDDSPYKELSGELWSDIPQWIPTGACSLDYAIGGYVFGKVGGIPHRRVVEIWGPESSGKSALLDHIIINYCKVGGIVLLGDRENSHQESRLLQLGAGPFVKRVRYISKPVTFVNEYGEKVTEFVNDYTIEDFMSLSIEGIKKIRTVSNAPILLGLDSLAYTLTDAQQLVCDGEGDFNMKVMTDMSRVLAQRFSDFCSDLTKYDVGFVVVNQVRQKPGQVFGDPDYSPGGNSKNHAFSIRIKLSKGTLIKPGDDPIREHEGKDPVGLMCSFVVNKNKVAPPYRTGEFALYFDDRGIFKEETFARLLVNREKYNSENEFEKSGSWFSWKGERIGQGIKNMAKTFSENPDLMEEIEYALFKGDPNNG
jgi:recombination protein RecA